MTAENLGFFLSGLIAGTVGIADVALVVMSSAGFWRWGVAAICCVFGVLTAVGGVALTAYGADPLMAVVMILKWNLISAVVLLPIAAVLAWAGWKFWNLAGGLHAK